VMRDYLAGQQPIPDHRLIKRLGVGSYGEVWMAEAPGGVLVALKIISKIDGIDAIREWQSLQEVKNVKHANLVDIYGVWLRDEQGRVLSEHEIRALIPDEASPPRPAQAPPPRPSTAPKRQGWTGQTRAAPSASTGPSLTIFVDA